VAQRYALSVLPLPQARKRYVVLGESPLTLSVSAYSVVVLGAVTPRRSIRRAGVYGSHTRSKNGREHGVHSQ
jgi:hypothetical protein